VLDERVLPSCISKPNPLVLLNHRRFTWQSNESLVAEHRSGAKLRWQDQNDSSISAWEISERKLTVTTEELVYGPQHEEVKRKALDEIRE
jgi:hypothetical protein